MFRRMLLLLCSIVGVALLALPGVASAQELTGYKVKLTGWPGDQTANAVAIGDVNGDGVPDYVIGDTMASPNGRTQAGAVYVIYGEASDKTTPRTVDLSQIPLEGQGSSSVGYRIDGAWSYDHFGTSVAVGDLNSDGVGDIAVGAPDASPNYRSHSGGVYVIYGQKSTNTPEIDDRNLSAGQGTVITGWANGDETGQSVAIGRFNSDSPYGCKYASGQNSLAIGAPDGSPNGVGQAGEVYDLYGTDFTSGPGTLDLAYLGVVNGYLIQGHWAGDQLGQTVADGGDVNHNCSDTILAGDPQAGPNGMPQSGTVYVVFGRPRGANSAEDVSTLEQNGQGYRINGPASYAHYGASVANAGDIDGDGIPDVIAGAPNYNNGAGEAIVTYGENASNAADINTANLGQSAGYAIQGAVQDQLFAGKYGTIASGQSACDSFHAWTYWGSKYPNDSGWLTAEGDRVGTSVDGLGDVNHDGVPDMAAGAPGLGESSGGVVVIYGHRGRNHGNISLATAPSPLFTELGGNFPKPQDSVYGLGNPSRDPAGHVNPQIIEQTEEAFSDSTDGWLYCSNYMVEHGDQVGTALASTTTGSGAFAVIGAPSYGESNHLSWNGAPGNPTVWFSNQNAFGQVGVSGFGTSGEADWAVTPGNGAAYVLGF